MDTLNSPEVSDDDVSLYYTPREHPATDVQIDSSDDKQPVAGFDTLIRATMEHRRKRLAPSESSSCHLTLSRDPTLSFTDQSDCQTHDEENLLPKGRLSLQKKIPVFSQDDLTSSSDEEAELMNQSAAASYLSLSQFDLQQDSFNTGSSHDRDVTIISYQSSVSDTMMSPKHKTTIGLGQGEIVLHQSDEAIIDPAQNADFSDVIPDPRKNSIIQRTTIDIGPSQSDACKQLLDDKNTCKEKTRELTKEDMDSYHSPGSKVAMVSYNKQDVCKEKYYTPNAQSEVQVPLITIQSPTPKKDDVVSCIPNLKTISHAPTESTIASYGAKGFHFRNRMPRNSHSEQFYSVKESCKINSSQRRGAYKNRLRDVEQNESRDEVKQTSRDNYNYTPRDVDICTPLDMGMSQKMAQGVDEHDSSLKPRVRLFRGMTPVHNMVLTKMNSFQNVGFSEIKPTRKVDKSESHPNTKKKPPNEENVEKTIFQKTKYYTAKENLEPDSLYCTRRHISFTPKIFSTANRRHGSMMSGSCHTIASMSPTHQYRSAFSKNSPNSFGNNTVLLGASGSGRKGKLLRTLFLVIAYMLVGMSFSILGPTLLDIADFTNSSIQQTTQMFTSRGAGTILGSIISGVLFDHFNYYLTYALAMGVSGAMMFVIPITTSYTAVMVVVFLSGTALGFLDAASQVLCVYIWGADNATYMQAMHFLYGVGSILGPIIAEPFVRKIPNIMAILLNRTDINIPYAFTTASYFIDTQSSSESDFMTTSISLNTNSNSSADNSEDFKFQYAYFLLGSFCILSTLSILLVWAIGEGFTVRAPLLVIENNNSCEPQTYNRQKVITIVTLLTLFHFFHMGTEISYKGLISAFSVKALDWSRQTSALLAAACYVAYTAGRGIGMMVASSTSPVVLITGNLALMLISLVLEVLLVRRHAAVLWVTACIHGFGQSTVLPSSLTWLDQLLDVNSKIAGILMFGASAGMMVIPGLVGWLMDAKSTMYFVSLHLASVCCMIIIFVLLLVYARKTGSKDEVGIMKTPKRTSVQNVPESDGMFREMQDFTGSPVVFNTTGTKYGRGTLNSISHSPSTKRRSGNSRHSVQRSRNFTRQQSVVKTPYAMQSHTPLILMTFMDK